MSFNSKCYGKCYKIGLVSEKVVIPRGVDFNNGSNSMVVRIKGKGNVYILDNSSICYSDLYVRVKIDDHDYFKREGDNIFTNYYITISQAVLGTELNIRTLHGIKIVKLRRYKDKVVLMNEGINKKGKHIVKIIVKFPSLMSEEQEKIFRQILEFDKTEKSEII